PIYEQHVRTQQYTVMKPCLQEYQVPVQWTTYHPVYEQHVRIQKYCVMKPVWQEYQVPVQWTTYKPVYEQHVRKHRYTGCEPVWTERCYKVCTGCWQEEKKFIPGPTVTKCCRTPGTWTFDPCTCTSHYCPGSVISYEVQCPGKWVCCRVWVPREEVRTEKVC